MDIYVINKKYKLKLEAFILLENWVTKLPNYPARSCRISSTHSILFPVINCEVNFLECPELRTNAGTEGKSQFQRKYHYL